MQVRRVEYLITELDGDFVPWSLERGCSPKCNDFCVTMGARTKVTYCTSCCNTTLCNTDNGAGGGGRRSTLLLLLALVLLAAHNSSPERVS